MQTLSPQVPRTPISRPYMSKSHRACDFCRTRRSACRIDDGPPCRLCLTHNRSCTFLEPARRRVKRVRIMEGSSGAEVTVSTPATNEEPTEGEEDAHWLAALDLNMTFSPLPTNPNNDATMPPGIEALGTYAADHQDGPQAPAQDVLDIPDFDFSPATLSELTRILSASASAASCAITSPTSISQLSGLTGEMDPYLLARYRFDPGTNSVVFKRLAMREMVGGGGGHPVQFAVTIPPGGGAGGGSSDSVMDCKRAELEQMIGPDVGRRLIDLYFRFIFPQTPIFLVSDKPDVSSSPPHLLAAIYAVAAAFSSFDDELCISIVYEEMPLQQLRKMAWDEVQAGVSQPTISHLQTALLLVMAPPENPVLPDGNGRWSLLGNIVTMAQIMGLYHDPKEWLLPAEESSLRRRLSWNVRYAEIWLAASLGRIPLISSKNWLVESPTSVDFDEQEEQAACRVFVPLNRLTSILTSVLEHLYTLQDVTALGSDYRYTLRTARPIMQELAQWHEAYEMHSPSSDQTTDASPTGVLHLGYHAVKMWILRATMRPFHILEKSGASASGQGDGEAAAVQDAWRHLRLAAERAGTACITFTAELDSGCLYAFWPFWSAYAWCSAAGQMCTLLLVMAQDVAEARGSKAALDRLRRVLRLQAKSLSILRFTLLRLDSMYWKGFDRLFELSPVVQQVVDIGRA
ncbi:hypothetical protein LTR62_005475 [Meristemomyces frigidus]|uniref:Zn(2)-C6 fungal-type domain-containing protein n=1 Tax=Meristemomyces frigidus TaxID=1508187 RepID=A0AAN7TPN3_9PEZI|nr:hypothetical protein LTR62_005475 [Meristemomyces frigidus]